MEDNTQNIKISYLKNLNNFNFNTTLNISVDANVNIKNILNINTYLYDKKVECGNGKAIISGKIGVKVLYIDVDNMTNILTDSQNFSETYLNNLITSDTHLNISNSKIMNNILSSDGTLKINCDINISPTAYLNLGIANKIPSNEMLITKKDEVKTNTISAFVDTSFEYTTNSETQDKISKILCCQSSFIEEKIVADDGFAVVEGKIVSSILYETNKDDDVVLKELKNTSNIKYDIEIAGLTKENILDLSFTLDQFNENISTEIEENNSVIVIKHKIKTSGVVLQSISIDVVDDLFSTQNEIETTFSTREYVKNAEHFHITETILNEITLQSDETAIDEVLSNMNLEAEITNTYIKDETIFVEGIVSSNLCFIDENKEIKHKQIESPFIINTKIRSLDLGCVNNHINITNNYVKVKRGTIIECEYNLCLSMVLYEKENREIIDTYSIGKPFDFSKYDYQIFLTKPNESLWDLCKRIKISPSNIHEYNKNLPLVMTGEEKIIIKR